ncbi:1-phosphatidylinositol 4,5-bisphosphate phosphodiesterase eta-2-like isoform X2 [Petromyzon marinus]|uniref:Phosphoinositide phospholipase C n=1 Tax=Petromyzon marinus TaxID=7757 RepID=A0AAJ7X3N6_PETMA|nr:1-phosphatidylinositol 4,5-bisphosphate phosphodiesterase eta-2-like isoform X2 [Petromyzon marinus]
MGCFEGNLERCVSIMQAGSTMLKLRPGSRAVAWHSLAWHPVPRVFYLDESRRCICWHPSRKRHKAAICIDAVREVRQGWPVGAPSGAFRPEVSTFAPYDFSAPPPGGRGAGVDAALGPVDATVGGRGAFGQPDSTCVLSVFYGAVDGPLVLMTACREQALAWRVGLTMIMAGMNLGSPSSGPTLHCHQQLLVRTFAAADRNGDGRLALDEIRALLSSLNLRLSRQRLHDLIQATDVDNDRGFLSFVEFSSFYALMSSRRDLLMLMNRHVHKTQPWQSDASGHFDRKPLWNVGDLARFMTEEQKVPGVTRAMCLEIIDSMEPNAENRRHGCLSLEGDAVDPAHGSVHQDMGLPLTRYCIASSHNTYLTGDQVTSRACADSYASVLRAGCRCVEVDSWDGPDGEPMVTHGRTLTTRIPFQDVLRCIGAHSFTHNPYPVIVSLENHCSLAQQDKMAHYLQSILGDLLLLPSDLPTADAQWPSPQSLMGKILLKGKKISVTTQGVDDDESESETSANHAQGGGAAGVRPCADEVAVHREGRATVRRSRSLLGLLPRRKAQNCREKAIGSDRGDKLPGSTKRPVAYTVSSPCKPREPRREPRREPSPRAGPPIPRARTPRLSRALSELTACSRARGAIDVGSHGPPPRWSVTSFAERQASALASEHARELAAFTSARLARVYPSAHRMSSSNYDPEPFWNAGTQMVSLNYQTEGRPMQLNRAKFAANGNCGYVLKPAEMCTGHFNPLSDDPYRGRARTYLRVRVISGQRLPKPAVSRLPSRDEIIDPYVEVEVVGLPVDSAVRRTRVVDDNGFQPLWDETLVFIIHMPELAMVRFVVWDDDPIGRNFIGQKTIALSSILPGYRHVRLESLSEASIFVYVTVEQIHGKARQASNLMRALGSKSRECGVGDAPRRKHGMRATPWTSSMHRLPWTSTDHPLSVNTPRSGSQPRQISSQYGTQEH